MFIPSICPVSSLAVQSIVGAKAEQNDSIILVKKRGVDGVQNYRPINERISEIIVAE